MESWDGTITTFDRRCRAAKLARLRSDFIPVRPQVMRDEVRVFIDCSSLIFRFTKNWTLQLESPVAPIIALSNIEQLLDTAEPGQSSSTNSPHLRGNLDACTHLFLDCVYDRWNIYFLDLPASCQIPSLFIRRYLSQYSSTSSDNQCLQPT